MKKTLLVALALASVVATAHAADPTVNKILIPLNYNGPGAYGTHWKTFVEINNRTTRDLTTTTLLDPCPPAVNCGSPYLSAGNTGRLVSDAPHGIIFDWFNGPNDSGRLYGIVHIAAEPRDPATAGTEIPVATNLDFGPTFVLLNVPTGALNSHPIRTLLRIYSLDYFNKGDALVTVYAHDNPTLAIGSLPVTLVKDLQDHQPLYAEVDVSRFAPLAPAVDLVIAAGTATAFPQNNVFQSAKSPFSVWGFVTITDNATNDVTTITAR
jgi:hypothetical protein